jgi:uncharacterized membrane protein YfcA
LHDYFFHRKHPRARVARRDRLAHRWGHGARHYAGRLSGYPSRRQRYSTYVALFFALFMALVAGQMFLNWQPKPSQKPTTMRGLMAVGTGIGSVSALAAVGGGFLSVAYLGYKNVEMKRAVGTSAAIGFPIAIAGTTGYLISGWSKTAGNPYTLGFIYVPAFLAIALASSMTAPYGARCAHSLPDRHLKKIFAVISLILSITMLVSIAEL